MTKKELIEEAADHIRHHLREGVPHIELIHGMATTHSWLDGDDITTAFRQAGELLQADDEEMRRSVEKE